MEHLKIAVMGKVGQLLVCVCTYCNVLFYVKTPNSTTLSHIFADFFLNIMQQWSDFSIQFSHFFINMIKKDHKMQKKNNL